jgi:DNA-binding transcriptional ArsR family regulator
MSDVVSEVFSALGDPTRRWVYEMLVSGGGSSATELARSADVSRQAIAKHLSVLESASLVEAGRDGREVRYHPTANGTAPAVEWLERRAQQWDRRLADLGARVDRNRS